MSRRIRPPSTLPDDDPPSWRAGLEEANIPDRYRRARLDAIKEPTVRVAIGTILDHTPDWLGRGAGFYLHGPRNNGKSSIAALMAMDALRRFERVLWLPVRDLLVCRFREGPRGALLDDRLAKADLLILDDLGGERFGLKTAGGTALEEVFRVLYDRDRSVIVTSNISWRDFPGAYAEVPSFISIVKRCCYPQAVVNPQWAEEPPR